MADYNEGRDFAEHYQQICEMRKSLTQLNIEIADIAKVLDVGGGSGMHSCYLSNEYELVYCADVLNFQSMYECEFFKLFKDKCLRNNIIISYDRLQFIQTDAMDLCFKDNLFDFVVSFNALEHIPNPYEALNEMVRVAKQYAIIYVTFDPIWTADSGSHFIDLVPEPWSHLCDSNDMFVAKMLQNGSSQEDTKTFLTAMNRWFPQDYQNALEKLKSTNNIEILSNDIWFGVLDEQNTLCRNYEKLIASGYKSEDLLTRGMRFVLRKL